MPSFDFVNSFEETSTARVNLSSCVSEIGSSEGSPGFSGPVPLRVLIVDDHALFRYGLCAVLDPLEDIQVVGEAGSLAELSTVAPGTFDIVLLDIRLPDGSGIFAIPALRKTSPNAKIVMLTVSQEDEDLYAAVRAGAVGYLLKEIGIEQVVEAIRVVARGESSFSPQMAFKLVAGFTEMSEKTVRAASRPRLTKRELEVLQLVARGWSNRKIADSLYLSENTVKNHLRNVGEKLEVHSRTEAVVRAVKEGWIALE